MTFDQKKDIIPEQVGINIKNETRLHSSIKRWYSIPGDRFEVKVDGSIIDIVRGELLIEVQTGNFSSIYKKLKNLLKQHDVRLVCPLPAEKWITTIHNDGKPTTRRKSPRKGRPEDIFYELVRITGLMEYENFSVDILMVNEEEFRLDDGKGSWRRKGISIIDRDLIDVVGEIQINTPMDLLQFIPEHMKEPFTNSKLSGAMNMKINLTRKMTYCMRKLGLIEKVGKIKNEILFKERGHTD